MAPHERSETGAANESQVGQLLKVSGRRRMPAEAQMSRARVAARAEWVRAARNQRWRVWRPVLTSAVAAVIALAAWTVWHRPSAPPRISPVDVATLRTVRGSLLVTRNGQQRQAGDHGQRLQAGDRVTSQGDSRAALLFSDDIDVRLDRETEVTLQSGRITLFRGAAYVDAGPGSRASVFAMETPRGIVRHVGTQFEVRMLGDALRVRVREGAVVIEHESARWMSRAGEALMIAPDFSVERLATATSGPDWNWVSELAEPFQLEGATLTAFLQWASREQGWQWQFDSTATERRVGSIVLRGSIDGLTPDEAVDAVLPTCGLVARRSRDRLIVGPPPER